MGIDENDYFFEISGFHRGITMLDERISAARLRGLQYVENDDKFDELGRASGPLNLLMLTRILSEGNVALSLMQTFRESLIARMRE